MSTFRSTVLAPAQIAIGFVSGVVVAVILEALDRGLWPAAIVAFLVILGVGVYVGRLDVDIDGERMQISQGRGDKDPRLVHANEIKDLEVHRLGWMQCFGIGLESDERTVRLTVRPGDALFVTLFNGEQLRVSVDDPQGAVAVLDEARSRLRG